MPRGGRSSSRSSYGSRSGRSASFSRSPPRQQTTPQPQQSSVPMQTGIGGGGLGQTLMTGMAFGAGSEVAHQAVRGLMGGHSNHNQQQQPVPQESEQPRNDYQQQNPCLSLNQRFISCLKDNGNEISECQSLFDNLKQCEKGIL